MDNINFSVCLLIAVIPLLTGMIWYSKMLFANAWMKAANINKEDGKKGNMIGIFIAAYVFSLLITSSMLPLTIHQFGVYSVLANEPGIKDPSSPIGMYLADFMGKYGHNFRTFKHGAFHGTIAALFIAMPALGMVAIFERKGFKYIAIHTGYWILTLALVGGCVCAFV